MSQSYSRKFNRFLNHFRKQYSYTSHKKEEKDNLKINTFTGQTTSKVNTWTHLSFAPTSINEATNSMATDWNWMCLWWTSTDLTHLYLHKQDDKTFFDLEFSHTVAWTHTSDIKGATHLLQYKSKQRRGARTKAKCIANVMFHFTNKNSLWC